MSGFTELSASFASVEELSQEMAGMGWSTDLRQLDCGPGEARLNVILSQRMLLQRVCFDRRTLQRFWAPQGYQSFGVPMGPVSFARSGDFVLGPGEQLLQMPAGEDQEATAFPDFFAYTVSFTDESVSAMALRLGLEGPLTAEQTGGLAVFPDLPHLSSLKMLLCKMFASERQIGCRKLMLATLETELLSLLLESVSIHQPDAPAQLSRRKAVMDRALAHIAEQPRDVLSVASLCAHSGGSIRTLERAFQERYAVSPKRFLVLNRLHRVQSALVNPNEERSIAEIANEWGFWHMGQFAADYRKLFGCLPSQTRARLIAGRSKLLHLH